MNRLTHALVAGASLTALVVAIEAGGSLIAARDMRIALEGSGVTVGSVTASLRTGALEARDLRFDTAGGAAQIGRISLTRGGPFAALAQTQDVTIENVQFAFGGATYKLPRIDIAGSSLSRADLDAAFRGPWSPAKRETFARLNASALSAPLLTIEVGVPDPKTPVRVVMDYRDLRMTNVAQGRIGQSSIAGATIKADTAEPGTPAMEFVKGDIGRITIGLIDLPEVLRFYMETARPGETIKPIFGGYTIEGGRLTLAAPVNASVSFGRASAGALSARPLKTPLAEILALSRGSQPGGKLNEADTAKVMGMLSDMFDSMESEQLGELTDLTVQARQGQMDLRYGIKAIRYGALKQGRFAEFAIDGLDVNAMGGSVKVQRFALEGLDLRSTFAAMPALAADPQNAAGDWRKLMPKLDAFVVRGVDVDVPNVAPQRRRGQPPQAQPQRIAATLGAFEIRLGNYVEAIPTAVRIAMDRLAGKVPEVAGGEALNQLKALGYDAVDLSFAVDGAWNEQARSFAFKEFGARGDKMGEIALTAQLGNVPREAFSGDPAQMQVALLSASAQNATFRLRNDGLLDKVIEMMAAQQKTTGAQLRAQYGSAAAVGIPAILGDSEGSKALASAIAAFIAKPSNIAIEARAKSSSGLGAADFMTMGSPADIVGKLDIRARANQ